MGLFEGQNDNEPVPNIRTEFLESLASSLALTVDRSSRLPRGISAHDIFVFVYAILWSQEYRDRYRDFLRTDFPRLPLPSEPGLFFALRDLGQTLVSLHLLENLKVEAFDLALVGTGHSQVEKVSYSDKTVWLDKAKTHGFQGVPEEVWNFHIGGYQVCDKWLKDREAKGGKNPHPGRVLTDEDIAHYQKIVVALHETIRIMQEIDEVIDQHGGWPDAFVTHDGGDA